MSSELYQIHPVAARQLEELAHLRMLTYLLHFSQKIGNPNNSLAMAQHYLGWSVDVLKRLREHLTVYSKASAIVWAARNEYHVDITLVRVWPGNWHTEKWLKGRRHGPDLCTCCNPHWERHARVVPADILAWSIPTDLPEIADAPPLRSGAGEAVYRKGWRDARPERQYTDLFTDDTI
jgi:hypothetical protein